MTNNNINVDEVNVETIARMNADQKKKIRADYYV